MPELVSGLGNMISLYREYTNKIAARLITVEKKLEEALSDEKSKEAVEILCTEVKNLRIHIKDGIGSLVNRVEGLEIALEKEFEEL